MFIVVHLAKYLFPPELVKRILDNKELIRHKAEFPHLKVNRFTGEIIY